MDKSVVLYDAIYAIKTYVKGSIEKSRNYDDMKLIINHYNNIIKYLEDNLK